MTEQSDTWVGGAQLSPQPAENGTGSRRAFPWGPWATLMWLAVIGFMTLVIISATGMTILAFRFDGSVLGDFEGFLDYTFRNMADLFLPLTILQCLVVIGFVLLLTRSRPGLPRAAMLGMNPIPFMRGLNWTVISLAVVLAVSELPRLYFDLDHDSAMDWLKLLQPVWLTMVLLVVFAPVSEELLFRGFGYKGLAASRVGPLGAIIVTSGIWTIIHVQYDWAVLAQVFIFGIVLGVARWQSGSIWPPMIAHALINLVAGTLAYGRDWGLV